MKNILKIWVPVLLLVLLGCSYSSDIDLVVENNTGGNIQIIYSFDGIRDTSSISSGTKLVVINIGDNKSTTENALENLQTISLDVLEIRDKNGMVYNQNIFDINNWEKIDPEYKGAEGKVLLNLTDNDFR